MSKTIKFTKMQGTGNDFVIVDATGDQMDEKELKALSISICDRHFGVGADGLILAMRSDKADHRMRMLNPDGSEAEMCGNGIRCFAKHIYDASKEKKDVFSVETLAGIMVPAVIVSSGVAVGAEVDMGEPRLLASEIPMTGADGEVRDLPLKVNGETFNITAVSMGNPHCVIFTDDLSGVDLAVIGPKIENHPRFPKRTNVEFVKVISDREIQVVVWERGAGITLACGTGACASVVAGALTGRISRRAIVHLPGGDLDIEWEKEDGHVAMRGPAESVFEGTYQFKG